MLWWWSISALAAPCPDVDAQTAAAWSAFDDAELESSLRAFDRAMEGLDCAVAPVSTERLVELRWLEALVALGRGERERAERAVDAALGIDPERRPPTRLGPEIAALHDQRRAAQGAASYLVSVQREGTEVWVDGRRVLPGAPVRVSPGRHLLQYREASGFVSDWSDIQADLALRLRPTQALPRDPAASSAAAWHVAGGVMTAAGLGMVGLGYRAEQNFLDDDYLADRYGECVITADCYADEREKSIQGDAFRVRALYLSGYLLTAMGVGTFASPWVFDLSAGAGGGQVRFGYRW